MKSDLAGLSDADLVVLAQKGDESAFEEIYDRHSPGVARALASFAGPDRDLLDDLTQDVFLRVIKGLSAYSPSHPFSHWLYTIALNAGRNHARRPSKTAAVDPAELEDIAGTIGRGGSLPEEIVSNALTSLVSGLPAAMQEVVSLRIGSGMSYGEIGDLLGIPEATARSRMFHAVGTLRKQIGITCDFKRSSEK